jgi:hypothetical protein
MGLMVEVPATGAVRVDPLVRDAGVGYDMDKRESDRDFD